MKQFSIHKVNKPVMRRNQGGQDSANEDGEISDKPGMTGEGEMDGGDMTGPAGETSGG